MADAAGVVGSLNGHFSSRMRPVETNSDLTFTAPAAILISGQTTFKSVEMSHMIELQNAYGANARVIAAVQSMLDQFMSSIK